MRINMKKTITAILLLTMCAVGASAKIKHPSLLFTPARVEAARKAMRSDSVMAASWEHIKAMYANSNTQPLPI